MFASDGAGNVYVADTNNDRIQKFDSNGSYLSQWGTNGSGDGQFEFPKDVGTDAAGNVYAADAGNYRVQKFVYDAPSSTSLRPSRCKPVRRWPVRSPA
jgi:DNA-binding beta-propeller fold protein YncE